jgi:hypothetical protein
MAANNGKVGMELVNMGIRTETVKKLIAQQGEQVKAVAEGKVRVAVNMEKSKAFIKASNALAALITDLEPSIAALVAGGASETVTRESLEIWKADCLEGLFDRSTQVRAWRNELKLWPVGETAKTEKAEEKKAIEIDA